MQVAFQLTGEGQFLPVAEAGAAPHTGAVGQLEKVKEYRVEIFCHSRDVAKAAVAALKKFVSQIFQDATLLTLFLELIHTRSLHMKSTSLRTFDFGIGSRAKIVHERQRKY